MKRDFKLTAMVFLLNAIVLHSCKKTELSVLSTISITNITTTSASSGGQIISDGGEEVTLRGVCWSIKSNPTISDFKTDDGKGKGQFASLLTGLTAGTTYHVRAYAINSAGTAYGNDISFLTLGQSPDAIAKEASEILTTSAILNGIVNANYLPTSVTFEFGITTNYGQAQTANQNPVTGSGLTSVSSKITGLKEGTIYHFRIKTVNSFGITYSNDIEFTTLGLPPFTVTQSACCLSSNGATLNGLVSANYLQTTVSFEYGLTAMYGNSIQSIQNIIIGNDTLKVSANISELTPGTGYHFRLIAVNSLGTSYGHDETFTTTGASSSGKRQIIADHTIVDRFDDIPQEYIDSVKKMWVTIPGESHYEAYRKGCTLLEALYPAYQVNVTKSGDPEAYTDQYLRISNATWGDIDNSTGWIYNYGEEDWWTSVEAIARTKASIFYCNTNNLAIAAMGFAWCSDMSYGSISSSEVDPVYGCHWWGASKGSPSGNLCWGLDDGDKEITGNVVSISTYLNATQQYIDYCKSNKMPTRIFFTTGTVDNTNDHYLGERGYQSYLKDEYIRNYVRSDTSRILFDYADILTHDADGSITTSVWNGNSFPSITSINVGDSTIGHIGSEGAMRLGKALWWMLARMAGWEPGD